MGQYDLPRKKQQPRSTPAEPESYFPQYDTAKKPKAEAPPKRKTMLASTLPELAQAQQTEDHWYDQRGADMEVLRQMYGKDVPVAESAPPTAPHIRDQLASVFGERLATVADWTLPFSDIDEASYAAANRDPWGMVGPASSAAINLAAPGVMKVGGKIAGMATKPIWRAAKPGIMAGIKWLGEEF